MPFHDFPFGKLGVCDADRFLRPVEYHAVFGDQSIQGHMKGFGRHLQQNRPGLCSGSQNPEEHPFSINAQTNLLPIELEWYGFDHGRPPAKFSVL
jgi:hypothetical protein